MLSVLRVLLSHTVNESNMACVQVWTKVRVQQAMVDLWLRQPRRQSRTSAGASPPDWPAASGPPAVKARLCPIQNLSMGHSAFSAM